MEGKTPELVSVLPSRRTRTIQVLCLPLILREPIAFSTLYPLFKEEVAKGRQIVIH